MLLWKRLRVALRLVGRVNRTNYRTSPRLAWSVACTIYPSPSPCRWPACSCLPNERCTEAPR